MPAAERVIVVDESAAGDRLDAFLHRHIADPERSRSEWQRLIGVNAVLVNGLHTKPSHRLSTNERVTIASVVREVGLPPQEAIAFEVVYEDPAMIVVNKPGDFVWHPFWWEQGDGTWIVNHAVEMAYTQITTGAVLYRSWFKNVLLNIDAYRLMEPADWNRFRRIKYIDPKAMR